MNTAEKNSTPVPFTTFTVFCMFVLFTLGTCAYAQDESLLKIQALVGMKISPKNITTPGRIQGFRLIEGGLLVLSPGNKTWIGMPALDFGYFDKTAIFLILRVYPDKTTEVVNVQILPMENLEMQLKDGIISYNNDGFRFSGLCSPVSSAEGEGNMSWYVGLIRAEEGRTDCTHSTTRIFKAWRIDQRIGTIKEVSADSVQCEYLSADSCD